MPSLISKNITSLSLTQMECKEKRGTRVLHFNINFKNLWRHSLLMSPRRRKVSKFLIPNHQSRCNNFSLFLKSKVYNGPRDILFNEN